MLKKLATVSLSLALICSSTVSFAGDSLLSQGTIVTPLKIEETISPRVVTLFYESTRTSLTKLKDLLSEYPILSRLELKEGVFQ